MKKNSESPAFPPMESENEWGYRNYVGLTKREYFAAMAMQALVSVPNTGITKEGIAERAISMADELLKQLES